MSNKLEFEQARKQILALAKNKISSEPLPLHQCMNRVLAKALISPVAVPNFAQSMMDGYALNQKDLVFDKQIEVSDYITAGSTKLVALKPKTAVRLMTGSMIPKGANIVVPQENVAVISHEQKENNLQYPKKIIINQHKISNNYIRAMGSSIDELEKIFPAGHKITAKDMPHIASTGLAELEVFEKLKVAVMTTGDELVPPGTTPLPTGKIYNSNGYLLDSLVLANHFDLFNLGNIDDDLAATKNALLEAADLADIVITTGGVSVGDKDFVRATVKELGELNVFSVNMKPGKPLAYGHINNTPFIGLPGNPVSAFVVMHLFGMPLMQKLSGRTINSEINWQYYPCKTEFATKTSRTEFVRAKLVPDTDNETDLSKNVLEIFHDQDSGNFSSVKWADGLAMVVGNTTIKKNQPLPYMNFEDLIN